MQDILAWLMVITQRSVLHTCVHITSRTSGQRIQQHGLTGKLSLKVIQPLLKMYHIIIAPCKGVAKLSLYRIVHISPECSLTYVSLPCLARFRGFSGSGIYDDDVNWALKPFT
jgi:hypothetical protein